MGDSFPHLLKAIGPLSGPLLKDAAFTKVVGQGWRERPLSG